MKINLQERWHELIARFTAKDGNFEYRQISTYYQSAGRYYHNPSHLQHIFATFDSLNLTLPADETAIIEFSAWFHDIIYDPKAKDNEERSAELAAQILTTLEIPQPVILATHQIILDTKRHQASSESLPNLLFLDLDLAILGAPVPVYAQYCQNIRLEYSWVSESDYQTGRLNVLQNFNQRAKIYFTDVMHHKYDATARQNLEREIAWLKKS
jgi:predicted metal-dependent HD superfamily phosphohydrolase